MATLRRRLRLPVGPDTAFAICLRLLTDADPARGIVVRRCTPLPPGPGSEIATTVRDRRGERVLRARLLELEPPRLITTASDDAGPAVRTRLAVEPDAHGSVVTLTSEATTALGAPLRATGVIDRVLLGRAQRRAAAATLGRLRQLAAAPAPDHGEAGGSSPGLPSGDGGGRAGGPVAAGGPGVRPAAQGGGRSPRRRRDSGGRG